MDESATTGCVTLWAGLVMVMFTPLSPSLSPLPPQGPGCHLFILHPSTGWREHSVKYSIIIFMVNSIWRGMMLIRQPRPQTDSLLIVLFVNLRSEGPGSSDCLFSTRQYSSYLSAGSAEEDARLPLLCKITRPVSADVWLKPLSTSGSLRNFL